MRRAPALSFLLVTVFLDTLGLGLIVPIVPALMSAVAGDPASAVLWSGILGSSYGALQFAVSPLLGRLSDRYGRRPVLLASLACLGVDWLAHALASGPWTLLAFHALAGAAAGTTTVVHAYVADVTPPGRRAHAYGRIGAAAGLGFVAGPILGGLLGAADARLPFHAAAALSFAGVAYGRLVLPESRPGDPATPLTFRTVNPFGALLGVLRRPVLGRLAGARFCADVARMTYQSVWTFFLTYQFAWSTARIGVVMAASALAGALFQARAAGPIVGALGEKPAAVAGTLLSAASFAGLAVVSSPWPLHAWQAAGVVGAVAAQSWVSRSASADEQGAVQGALTALGAVAETAVPVVAGAAFGAALAHARPGAVFAGAALFAAASALLLACTPPSRD